MARLHVLDRTRPETYRIVVHEVTPAGNNSAGVTWVSAIVASGRNQSILTVGNGPGQIGQNEMNSILAGTVIEASFEFQDDPAWSPAERTAALDQVAGQTIAEMLAQYSADLKWYGATRL